jgi:hypothetical protein
MVRVTGYLKRFKMTFPVFDDKAEEAYHNVQSATKRMVSMPGKVNVGTRKGLGAGDGDRVEGKSALSSLSQAGGCEGKDRKGEMISGEVKSAEDEVWAKGARCRGSRWMEEVEAEGGRPSMTREASWAKRV